MAQAATAKLPAGGALRAGLGAAQFAWLVGSLCRIHRLPFDAALLLQQFPPPHDRALLLEALRAYGFRASEALLARGGLKAAPLPAIAFLRPTASEAAPMRPPTRSPV